MTRPRDLASFLDRNRDVALVRLTRVRGSSPRDTGTEMFVAPDDCFGTIGGGQLEYMVIDAARAMMASGKARDDLDIPLGPEIGQCCGGRVDVSLTMLEPSGRRTALQADAKRRSARPHVYVMGAGHVGRALARLLAQMPVHTVVVDSRTEEMRQCTDAVERRQSAFPEIDIDTAPPGSAFVVLTHDHALDFLLTSQALSRGDAAYVGMIGSATKRSKFRNWCRDHCDGQSIDALTCPIGAVGSHDKRPEVIAAFVTAELMAVLTRTADKPAPHRGDPLHMSG